MLISPASTRKGAAAVELAPEEITSVLAALEEQVGKPVEAGASSSPARLIEVVQAVTEKVTNSWLRKLEKLPVRLIEEPAYRLAGAEEAIRHMVATIEQILRHHEPLTKELNAKAEEAWTRIQLQLAPLAPGQRRPPVPAHDVVELLRFYAKHRFQSQLMHQVAQAFLSLRGHLSDELREINFCRVRLNELVRQLEPDDNGKQDVGVPAVGRLLFPAGCGRLQDAAQQFIKGVTPEQMFELDARIQDMIKQKFTALVTICMVPSNHHKNVEPALLEVAGQFIEELMTPTNAAQLFLDRNPDPEKLKDEAETLVDEALPRLRPQPEIRADKLTVLAVPPGEAGDVIRQRIQEALADEETQAVTCTEDVLIYREYANLPLSQLPHLGAQGETAYKQMNAAEHFTPHTRIDIDFAMIRK